MKIYIDNAYNPVNKEAAEILYETGKRAADNLRERGFVVMLSADGNGTQAGQHAVLHINQANDLGADFFVASI